VSGTSDLWRCLKNEAGKDFAATSFTPLFGNSHGGGYRISKGLLFESWAQVQDGQGQVVLLRKSQSKVLAVFSLGIALARSCTPSVAAAALAALGKPDTVTRPAVTYETEH
jgi:hypothetical protein